jgi:phage-related tail protein
MLTEQLNYSRQQLEEKSRKLEQFTDDLGKIKKAIARRDQKCEQLDIEIRAGRERLDEVKQRAEEERRICIESMRA